MLIIARRSHQGFHAFWPSGASIFVRVERDVAPALLSVDGEEPMPLPFSVTLEGITMTVHLGNGPTPGNGGVRLAIDAPRSVSIQRDDTKKVPR